MTLNSIPDSLILSHDTSNRSVEHILIASLQGRSEHCFLHLSCSSLYCLSKSSVRNSLSTMVELKGLRMIPLNMTFFHDLMSASSMQPLTQSFCRVNPRFEYSTH